MQTTKSKSITASKPAMPRNGVDTPALFATIGAVSGQRELANFKFLAQNTWQNGTHSRTEINWFAGAGGEHTRDETFVAEADHPTPLVGADKAPSAPEWILHALAGCLTSGIANIAAARGVDLESVESTVDGDINLLGILGLDEKVRNGFSNIRVSFDIRANATDEVIAEIVEKSKARSAVLDMLTNGLPVSVDVKSS